MITEDNEKNLLVNSDEENKAIQLESGIKDKNIVAIPAIHNEDDDEKIEENVDLPTEHTVTIQRSKYKEHS